MNFYLQSALVFLSLVAVDVCWTFYIRKASEGRAIAAATWSALIMICGAFAAISYIEDKRLLPAAILGAFVGTYAAVAYKGKEPSK